MTEEIDPTKCQICGKGNATVHYTEIINKNVTEMHICQSCALKKGFQQGISPGKKFFPLADLLSGLMDIPKAMDLPEKKVTTCPYCKMSYEKFKKIGRFGCCGCYESFQDSMSKLMRRIHGSVQHQGKFPEHVPEHKQSKEPVRQDMDIVNLKKTVNPGNRSGKTSSWRLI